MDSGVRNRFPKDSSVDSLASLEDLTKENEENLKESSDDLPSDIEVIEVEGEGHTQDDEWMDIIGSGDLKKKIVVAGIVESRPVKGDSVLVEVTMRLSDGTLVQDTHSLTFTLGDCEVINGFDLVVPLMDRGETSDVFIASRFAYGSKGEGELIKPNTDLKCTVTLQDFTPESSPDALNVAERQAVGNRKRTRGNWWFNRGDYSEAVQCYKAAVDFLDDTEDVDFDTETRPEVLAMLSDRLKALNNMAAAQIKLGAFDAALVSVSSVLSCQPQNVKALFRKAKVLQHKDKLTEAHECLRTALALDPSNKVVHMELSKLSQLMKEEERKEKSMYRRMLGVKKNKKEEKRYPTVDFTPWKVFLTSFAGITSALLLYNYRQTIWSIIE